MCIIEVVAGILLIVNPVGFSAIMMCLLIWDCMYNLYRMYMDKSMQNRWKVNTKLYQKIHKMI